MCPQFNSDSCPSQAKIAKASDFQGIFSGFRRRTWYTSIRNTNNEIYEVSNISPVVLLKIFCGRKSWLKANTTATKYEDLSVSSNKRGQVVSLRAIEI